MRQTGVIKPADSTPPPATAFSGRRVLVLCGAAFMLWMALSLFHLSHYSEKVHVALPLLWLLDFALFRPRPRWLHWLVMLAMGSLCYGALWAVLRVWAAQQDGTVGYGEPLWWLFYGASILVIYQGLCLAGVSLLTIMPAWRARYGQPRGRLLRGLRILLTLVLFVPYVFVAGNAHRVKVLSPDNPRQSLHLPYQEVTFPTAVDGLPLRGWFIAAPHPRGTVLLVHGVGASKADLLAIAGFLHQTGCQVFLFDLRGHGDSPGHTTSFGYYEARDVRGAMEYLQRRGDAGPVVGYAFSMGGASLLQAMPYLSAMKGVILDSSFADLTSMARSRFAWLPEPIQRGLLAAIACWTRVELGAPLADIAPVRDIGLIAPRPVLIIHGTSDEVIPYHQSQILFQAARPPKQLWLVPGVRHVAAYTDANEEYERRVRQLLRCVMEPGRPTRESDSPSSKSVKSVDEDQ